MSALICGSLAYDTIMVFPEQFKEHILPDKVHILNVAFLGGKEWPGNNPTKFSKAVRIYWDFVLRRDPSQPRRSRSAGGYEQSNMEV